MLNAGCNEQFLNDYHFENTVTVNVFFSPQDTFRLNLSYSENPYEWETDSLIDDAEIYLKLPDNSVKQIYRDTMIYGHRTAPFSGYYKLSEPIPFQPGGYQLTILVPDHEKITSIDSIPEPVKIDYCRFYPDTVNDNSYFILGLTDPVDENNYYAVSVNTHWYYTTWYGDLDSTGGGYYSQVHSTIYNERINSDNFYVDAVITRSLPQIIFSDARLSNETHEMQLRITCNAATKYMESDSLVFDVQLHSISKTYYDYAVDYYEQNMVEKEFYVDPVTVYSNIEGGYGIFAGYNTSTIKVAYIPE